MTAANHAVTGALIITSVANPFLALVLAFLSHFGLDILPHYGDSKKLNWSDKRHKVVMIVDTVTTLLLFVFLIPLFPDTWPLMWLGAVVSVSPDLLWLPYYIGFKKSGNIKEFGPVASVLRNIQWGERPWGWIIEIIWFVASLWLLLGRVV